MRHLIAAVLAIGFAVVCPPVIGADQDADGDGLSDYQETHKYRTDPRKADSDGDGIPDGDRNERREYTYTVRAVMHIMRPYNLAAMTDDYQDAFLLDEQKDHAEIEVILYPFNTMGQSIPETKDWRKIDPALLSYVHPGITTNWDESMRKELTQALADDGIKLAELSDKQVAEQVSRWLLKRAKYEDSFTTFGVAFENGKPVVPAETRPQVEKELAQRGRTLQEQWDRELLGRGMFRTRMHGSCTSSAIYLATGLKAAGLPTRSVICVPVIDASDPSERPLIKRLTHHQVRQAVQKTADRLGQSWASHTFNEVYVGGRWRRLNYQRLGQPILDPELLGLMVHVNTFADHGEAGLIEWGRRNARANKDDVCGGSNPYSCISLSDRFGVHATVDNPPVPADPTFERLTISKIYWYDGETVQMRLDNPDTAGHVIVRVDEHIPGESSSQYREVYSKIGKDFVFRAAGQQDVRAQATRGYWVDSSKNLRDFYLQIPPDEFGKMKPGIAYELIAIDQPNSPKWVVKSGLSLTRPKADKE